MDEVIMTDCDTTQIINNSTSFKKPKTHKRRKIRRLVDSEDLKQTKTLRCKRFKFILVSSALLMLIAALLIENYFFQNNSNTKNIFKEFLKNYRNHYTEVVYGKSNYCDQKELDTTMLFSHIKEYEILHQEHAMHQIELALRNENYLNAIALVGPVGVGKSAFIRALQKNFPWQENVQTYAWNTYVDEESKKFRSIRILIHNLSECGQNLVIIENLQARDRNAVVSINQLLLKANKKLHNRVIIFYVFTLNTMLTGEEYESQEKVLQSLPDCNVINFKPFTKLELRDCIQREAEIENVSLTIEDFDEIVETIDPFTSGCKNVNAKVLVYGTIETKKG